VAPLDLTPELVRLGEEVMRVDREHAGLRLELEQHLEQDRLLFLERAGERDFARERVEAEAQDLPRAHRLDVTRQLQAGCQEAPPSACRRAARAVASRARS